MNKNKSSTKSNTALSKRLPELLQHTKGNSGCQIKPAALPALPCALQARSVPAVWHHHCSAQPVQMLYCVTIKTSLEPDRLLCTHMHGKGRGSVYSPVFQRRRKNSHLSVMVVVWVSAGNDLELLICIFFHCKMISNALAQGEDPKSPQQLKATLIAHNLHPLSSAKSKDKTLHLPPFPVVTVFSARCNLQHCRSQLYCSTQRCLMALDTREVRSRFSGLLLSHRCLKWHQIRLSDPGVPCYPSKGSSPHQADPQIHLRPLPARTLLSSPGFRATEHLLTSAFIKSTRTSPSYVLFIWEGFKNLFNYMAEIMLTETCYTVLFRDLTEGSLQWLPRAWALPSQTPEWGEKALTLK